MLRERSDWDDKLRRAFGWDQLNSTSEKQLVLNEKATRPRVTTCGRYRPLRPSRLLAIPSASASCCRISL